MESCKDQTLVYNIKLSSVGPSRVTGTDVTHELTAKDLAMKLHYIKGVYFFSNQASEGLTIMKIKEPMFYWFNDYYNTCGRFRRSDAGRPYMKCNDCGVRFIEAQCDKTVDEWLEMGDHYRLNNLLVYHLPIGPDLFLSPPFYIQVTKFKCGGMSLGISWAHVLGDAFSASECLRNWTKYLTGLRTNKPLTISKSPTTLASLELVKEPLSLKKVEPVGDHWIIANNSKMEEFSFCLTSSQAFHLQSNIWGQIQTGQVSFFESLCATIWQCVAKVREGLEPKIVTLCKKDPNYPKDGALSNNQIISSARADFCVAEADLKKLAVLLVEQAIDERGLIEAVVEKDNGVSDYIVYGGNLTFVDFEGAKFCGLEWNGQKPEFVYYGIRGVGDEGAVWVLPWSKGGDLGKVVTVVMPENEVARLKVELKKNGLLLSTDLE